MSEIELRYPQWQEPFLDAVMETKRDDLMGKIQIAEKAASLRLGELENNRGTREERVALHDAASTLRTLKTVLIKSNNWTASIDLY